MEVDSKIESDGVQAMAAAAAAAAPKGSNPTAAATALLKSKKNVELSKYSGSRKSSIDTTNNLLAGMKNQYRLENTYKLSPDENKRFYAYKIYSNLMDLVAEKTALSEKNSPDGYNQKACSYLTRDLADNLKRETRMLCSPRYKVVVHIVVGEKNGQDVRIASRCLWNTEFDNCVTLSHSGKHVWVSAVIYVLYTE